MLIERFGLGYGDANALAHAAKAAATAAAAADDQLMARITGFGAFEVAPKKAYVSLRRSMCQYAVRLSTPAEIDARLLAWLRTAFDAAG